VNEDATLTIAAPGVLAGAADADGAAPGKAVLETGVQHGNLTLQADGSFVYAPAANFFGTDSFTYKAEDAGGLQSAVATVTITVGALLQRWPRMSWGSCCSHASNHGRNGLFCPLSFS
jgi:VCBS repeat-containing protein